MHLLLPLLALSSLDATAKPAAAAPTDNTWIAELRLADERLERLVDEWRRRQTGGSARDELYLDWLRRYSDKKYELSVLSVERDIKREAQVDAEQRLRDASYGAQLCEEKEQAAQEDLVTAQGDLSRRFKAANEALDGGDLNTRAARRALERWWGIWSELDLTEAVNRPDGLDALNAARQDVQRAIPGLSAGRASLEAALLASDNVLEIHIQRRDERARCQDIDPSGLAETAAQIRGDLHIIDAEIAEITAQLAELERGRPPERSVLSDPFLVEARTVSMAYDDARDKLDNTDSPIDHVLWCRIHVNGAMALMLAGDSRSDEVLTGAATAWNDGCKQYVDRWSDISLFQQQWASAQLAAVSGGKAALTLSYANRVSWTIDGLKEDSVGSQSYEIFAGPHRLELVPSAGQRRAMYVELVPGEHYIAQMVDGQIWFGLQDEVGSQRPPERKIVRTDDSPSTDDTKNKLKNDETPPQVDWSVTAGPAWVRFDGYDHVGGSLSLSRPLNPGDRARFELTLSHEMTRGERPYWYTTNLDSHFLLRERLSLSVARPLDHRLQPRAEISVGTIPFNAFLYGAHVGADWRVAQGVETRTFVRVLFNAGQAVWRSGTTPWDLSLNAGFGVHL